MAVWAEARKPYDDKSSVFVTGKKFVTLSVNLVNPFDSVQAGNSSRSYPRIEFRNGRNGKPVGASLDEDALVVVDVKLRIGQVRTEEETVHDPPSGHVSTSQPTWRLRQGRSYVRTMSGSRRPASLSIASRVSRRNWLNASQRNFSLSSLPSPVAQQKTTQRSHGAVVGVEPVAAG